MRALTWSATALVAMAPLTFSVSLAVVAPLGAQQRPTPTAVDSVTVLRMPFVVRDSQAARVVSTGNEAEVLRVVNELRAREARILRELQGTPLGRTDARRNLEEQLAQLSREAFTVMSVLESRCLDERATAPNGYLGVNLTSEVEVRGRTAGVRSQITSVEPGSPAERAGLASGDRLLEIGGRDARTRFPQLAGLLEPGRRVVVRVERDGLERSFAVMVAPRPQRYDQGCPQFERAIQPLRMGAVARVWVRDSADAQGNRVMYVLEPSVAATHVVDRAAPTPPVASVRGTPPVPRTPATPPVPPTSATPPTPAVAPAAPSLFVFGSVGGAGSSVTYFAGAQLRALDDDWRDVLGLKVGTAGVLVNEVASGSAAAQSGLKVGDVITEVAGAPATSPFVVARLLSLSEGRATSIRVIRKQQGLRMTLRSSPTPQR